MSDNVSIDALNKIAGTYTEGDLYVYRMCESPARNTTLKRYAIQWRIDYEGDSIFMFMNPGAWQITPGDAIEKEVSELKERITMNIFGTELFPYIQGDMLADAGDVTLTMTEVKIEELSNSKTTNDKPVVFFKERKKGLVLNKTNARTIAGMYGPETDDWHGQKITIYAERGSFFGKDGYAVRIRETQQGNGRVETPWTEGMVEDEEPAPAPAYENGTKIDTANAGELKAFETYIELEGYRPPSRAALKRWTGPVGHDEEE